MSDNLIKNKYINDQCLFSIVIPVFNGARVITKCLDSIYSQNLDTCDFEVICVDDCSTDPMCVKTMESYTFQNNKPENLHILKHEVNRKQGAARNTGVRSARGKWILYIDCDDFFVDGSLKELCSFYKKNAHLDIIIYSFSTSKQRNCITNLTTEEMGGIEFFQTQPVPWMACSYTYQRNFLIENNIEYVEDVFYEDTDYVIKAVLCANRMRFVNIPVFFYNIYEEQTSKLNSYKKIEDIFELSSRLKEMGIERLDKDPKSGEMIINHHLYLYDMMLKRYLWRLSNRNIRKLLKNYKPFRKSNFQYSFFVSKYSYSYVALVTVLRPILLITEKFLRNRKRRVHEDSVCA